MKNIYTDDYFMKMALDEAHKSYENEEVPIGAVVVSNDKIIGRGRNTVEQLSDVTAHAELLAITAASDYLGGKYLKNCTLYVTLEPCVMCAGALYWSQIDRLVYGADDLSRGYTSKSLELHPKTLITKGVLKTECQELLNTFFNRLRK